MNNHDSYTIGAAIAWCLALAALVIAANSHAPRPIVPCTTDTECAVLNGGSGGPEQ